MLVGGSARQPLAAPGPCRLDGTAACGQGSGCLASLGTSKISTSPTLALSPDPALVSRNGLCLDVGGKIREGWWNGQRRDMELSI